MKILFSGNTAWSMYNFRRLVFEHFLKQGHEVVVVSPFDETYQQQLKALGCKVLPIDIEAKGNNPLKDLCTCYHYRQIMIKEKPDYCFFYTIKPNIYGSMAAASLGISYTPVTTGLGYTFLVDNLISKIAKRLYKFAFRNSPSVWFLNKDDAESFVSGRIIQPAQVHILPGEGIDLSHFAVVEEPEEISFLLVARMLWDKGVGGYVDAARLLKQKYSDVRFKLLGFLGVDNPQAIAKEQMDEWVKEGVVDYLGVTTDVRPFIQDSTCVVLPSFYREGIPFTLMEGAASGRQLVATNGVGCKEVIDDGVNGFLCKLKDAEDLAHCMELIIRMTPEQRMEMGKKGREKMQKEFSMDIVLKHYEEVIGS